MAIGIAITRLITSARGGSCQQSRNGKRFRNSTVVDAPKGHLLVYSFRPRQYCKYGFSLTCRTVHSSLHWSSCLMISAPNAIRAGCAGLPLFTNCLAWAFSASSLGTNPLVVLVQLAIRERKVLNPHLSVHPIHTRILQNCTPFPVFWHYSRAVIIAHFAGKRSNFNEF